MARPKPDFKRMILKLPHSRQDYIAVAATAQLADLLGIELVGTYFDDASMLALAELPSAREFRSGGWQRLTTEQLVSDFARAAQEVERLFAEVAGGNQRTAFRKGKGSAAEAISSEAGVDDIVVIIEPKNPIERATHQFTELVEAAFRTSSSILLVPSRTMSATGPIIVLATNPEDPSFKAALAVACAARERMIVIPSAQSDQSLSSIVETARLAGIAATVMVPAFGATHTFVPAVAKGRLLIVRRSLIEHRARHSFVDLQVPTLLISSESQQ
jgi:hypothetical protein